MLRVYNIHPKREYRDNIVAGRLSKNLRSDMSVVWSVSRSTIIRKSSLLRLRQKVALVVMW